MLSHNAVLVKNNLSTRQITDKIVREYSLISKEAIKAGRTWYQEAEIHAEVLSDKAGSKEHAAAVISALSPRIHWSKNLEASYRLIYSGIAPGVMKRSIDNAKLALASSTPLDVLNGPKTNAFARAIAGDSNAVVIDVWMLRFLEMQEKTLYRSGVYNATARAFQLAADRVDETARDLQAIIWCHIRGRVQ